MRTIISTPPRTILCGTLFCDDKVVSEPNITPLLNCTCFDAETKDGSIVGITAYQMTTQTIYEIGGSDDVIGNAEVINRRLLAIALGVWDTVKNSGEFDADDYELDFLGFLPAKRESRRMVGDYVLNANDIIEGRIFADTVAYDASARQRRKKRRPPHTVPRKYRLGEKSEGTEELPIFFESSHA